MRKEHKTETKVDLLVPVAPNTIVCQEQTDCFGIEWDARSSECSICADETLCSIVWGEKVKDKKLTFEIEHGPLMDVVDFQSVDMTKVERLAKKYQDEGQPMTFQELQDVIAQQANTKDNEAVIQFIKRELPLTKIFLKEGVCLVR
jgi:uncharacterized Fe-S cluster-containing radical SAM superfamily enzyme